MTLLIKNGHVLDPATETDEEIDIFIEDGKIAKRGKKLKCKAERVIDAAGSYVMPGFIDLHVHLRDPGYEEKETIASGVRAAAKGGYTTILAMPNTKPVVDNADVVSYVHKKAESEGLTRVLQVGAVTKGQQGEELADIKGMVQAGSPAISEDGKSVMRTDLYREAMKIAAECKIPVLAHCEDIHLVQGGVVNADEITKKQGLAGITNSVEDVIIARDIILAKETGARLHLCHCSTKDSVTMVKQAKADGLPVTAEVCPHHFTLSTEDMVPYDTNYKMNPPLRLESDRLAVIEGLKSGVISVIATDHAPHHSDEKNVKDITKAPSGMTGLETSLSLGLTYLVEAGHLTLMQLLEKMTINPAQLYDFEAGYLAENGPADLTIFDTNAERMITEDFASKAANSPFIGEKLKGVVHYTICDGQIVYGSKSS